MAYRFAAHGFFINPGQTPKFGTVHISLDPHKLITDQEKCPMNLPTSNRMEVFTELTFRFTGDYHVLR